ncbi:MAG TPA: ABC transporter permease [Anaerolineales bacterium]|nr:ABC transporter permease [Anaerolineales bacterium]
MTLVARWFGSRFAPDSIPGRLRRDVWAWISGLIILLFIGGALFAPLLTSRAAEGEGEPNPPEKLLAPSAEHPFGTDQLGRDLYARVLFGGRTALTLGLLVVAVAVAVGVPLGAIAGYFGGWVDEVLMRLTDVFLAFPPLLLAIFIASALGASLTNAALAIAFTWWPWYTRLVRAQVVALRDRPFVEAARVMGVNDLVIIGRHILPNTLSPVIVQATLDLGSAILTGAALSFLGLGVQPPTADWGQMVSNGRLYFPDRWWYVTFPGLAIFLSTLAFNLLGDSVQDANT